MDILICKGQHDTFAIDATDRDQACRALMFIFEDGSNYCDFLGNDADADASEERSKMRGWYDAAKAGDARSATKLVTYRRRKGYEYEDNWHFETVINPRDFD